MIPEKTFYKFKNINKFTYDSLEKKYLYFSTPSQLNDKEDCRIPYEYESTNKNILNWIKHAKKLGKKMDGIDPKKFPFDTVAKVRAAVASDGKLKEILNFSAEKSINQFHLLSLTDSYINKTMWSHDDYCKDYSGICIGYKAFQLQYPDFKSYFIKVEKQQNTRKQYFLDCKDDLEAFVLTSVKYDNDRMHKYNPFEEKYDKNYMIDPNIESKNLENIKYNLFHKTKKWVDEQEYRGFYYSISDDNPQVKYPDETLMSITFGYKVSRKEIADIRGIIQEHYSNFENIDFFIAKPDDNLTIRRDKITDE